VFAAGNLAQCERKMDEEDRYFKIILQIINARHGLDFSQYQENTIKRRLSRRLAATRANGYREYVAIIENDPEESKRLIKDFTIKVSRFFRDRQVFELLSGEILPDLFHSKKNRHDRDLRIWCAGCAFGEEAFSMAIILAEYMEKTGEHITGDNIAIFGSDIDDEALNRAVKGVFNAEAVVEVREKTLDTYFLHDGDNHYQVIDSIKEMVTFCNHDITSQRRRSPAAGVVANYDLILCRNLLIYFTDPLQQRAFLNLFNSLNPGGYLILGKSESIPPELKDFFIMKYANMKIYQKILK
jgi:chemotaxis methyl-accepting protein methylase